MHWYDEWFRNYETFELGTDDDELKERRRELDAQGIDYKLKPFTVQPENKDFVAITF